MRTIPLPQARNLYLAKLSADGRQKLMPTVVAALNYFYGNLQRAPRELQSSLLGTGRRVRLRTVTRAKIKPCEMNKFVLLGNCDIKVLQAAALALVQFKALLRISEAGNLLKADVIQIDSNTWHLTVRRSKTDQDAKGAIVAFCFDPLEHQLWTKYLDAISTNSFSLSQRGRHYPRQPSGIGYKGCSLGLIFKTSTSPLIRLEAVQQLKHSVWGSITSTSYKLGGGKL